MDDKSLLKAVIKAKTKVRALKDLLFEQLNLIPSQRAIPYGRI